MSNDSFAKLVFFIISILLCLMMIIFISEKAKASECTSIRDEDKRRECLAVERRDPNDCTSIRNSDDRTLCRQRAGQRPLYRERY
jgi:hypothetical protein